MVEAMKPPVRENTVSQLEIVCYVAALLMSIGSIIGGWTFGLLIPLILLATVYEVLRNVRALAD